MTHPRMKEVFEIVDRGVKAQANDDLMGVFDALCDLKVAAGTHPFSHSIFCTGPKQ